MELWSFSIYCGLVKVTVYCLYLKNVIPLISLINKIFFILFLYWHSNILKHCCKPWYWGNDYPQWGLQQQLLYLLYINTLRHMTNMYIMIRYNYFSTIRFPPPFPSSPICFVLFCSVYIYPKCIKTHIWEWVLKLLSV